MCYYAQRTTSLDIPPAGDPALRWWTEVLGGLGQVHFEHILWEYDLFIQLYQCDVVHVATACGLVFGMRDDITYAHVTGRRPLQAVWADPGHRTKHIGRKLPGNTHRILLLLLLLLWMTQYYSSLRHLIKWDVREIKKYKPCLSPFYCGDFTLYTLLVYDGLFFSWSAPKRPVGEHSGASKHRDISLRSNSRKVWILDLYLLGGGSKIP